MRPLSRTVVLVDMLVVSLRVLRFGCSRNVMMLFVPGSSGFDLSWLFYCCSLIV